MATAFRFGRVGKMGKSRRLFTTLCNTLRPTCPAKPTTGLPSRRPPLCVRSPDIKALEHMSIR